LGNGELSPNLGGLGVVTDTITGAVAGGSCFAFRRRPSAKPGGRRPSFILPPGWKKLVDPSSGVAYFLNESDGKTQWEPPVNMMPAAPPPPPPGGAPLPPNWITANDPASGHVYYYNTATGASSWTPP